MPEQPSPKNHPQDSKSALLEARAEAIKDETERRANSKDDHKRRKSSVLPVLLLVTVAFGMYALITKPSWLVTPPPPPESPEIVEASLRVAMWQQALYVERFRAAEGELPHNLTQAGAPDIRGIFFTAIGDDSYLITGSNGELDLALRSEESFEDFLGESMRIIANREQP